jgi:polysaccharide biosynthesis protein PslG
MLNNGDEALKIWATEYGLSTTIKDEATQAEWVREFLDY